MIGWHALRNERRWKSANHAFRRASRNVVGRIADPSRNAGPIGTPSYDARRARGLAMLEMVLALPILVMIMALMINFGNFASWKLRADTASRHGAWATRPPRSPLALTYPRPSYWPQWGGPNGEASDSQLDEPSVNLPVVRGPTLSDASGAYAALVNSELLDPSQGFCSGNSQVHRNFVFLQKMGPYDLSAQTHMLHDKWQFWQFSWPANNYSLWANQVPRIPVIYQLPSPPASFAQAYVQAALAIFNYAMRSALYPIDRDQEWHNYHLLYGNPLVYQPAIGDSPDFYPKLNEFCSLDKNLAQQQVNDLINRIQGQQQPKVLSVAETMAWGFISLYQSLIELFQNEINATPPPPPGQIAALQGQIQALEQNIAILRQFLQSLQ